MSLSLSKDPAQEEADRLLERLKRLGAEWPSEPALRSLSPHVVDVLLERFAVAENACIEGPDGIITLLTLVVLGGLLVILTAGERFAILFGALLLLSAAIVVYKKYYVLYETRARNAQYPLYALTQADDMRVLPTLLRATEQEWGGHAEVCRGQQRLLKRVTEKHVGLLDETAQHRLWKLAEKRMEYQIDYNDPLALEALRALAHIGNAAMFERMCQLTKQTAHHEQHRRVIEARQELISFMEARLKRQAVPATLLRAASAPTSSPDTLLRSTYANPDPPEQLLRASASEDIAKFG